MEYKIDITLNASGYKGSDVDDLLPDFMTERPVTVGVRWWPSVEGPESLVITLAAGFLIAEVFRGFANELGEDMYKWSKSKLVPLLQRKRAPQCFIHLEFEDVTIFCDEPPPAEDAGQAPIALFFRDLPKLLKQVDPTETDAWEARWDYDRKLWVLEPGKKQETGA